jgi:internalin A
LIFIFREKSKIRIQIDFQNLEIRAFGVFKSEVSPEEKTNLSKYLFYVVMCLYWDIAPLDFDHYIAFRRGELTKDKFSIDDPMYYHIESTEGIYDKNECRPGDLYVSIDDKHFVKYTNLIDHDVKSPNINGFLIDSNRTLIMDTTKLIAAKPFEIFTTKKINKMKKIFISYSNEDVHYKRELEKFLKPLSDFKIAQSWSCEEITPGNWNNQIQQELENSDIVVFMLSINFINSSYIMEKEVLRTFELIKQDSSKKMIFVLVRNFPWNQFSKFKDIMEISEEELEDLKVAKVLAEIPNNQFLPYFVENPNSPAAKRYLHPLNQWQFPEDAYIQIIDKLTKIL